MRDEDKLPPITIEVAHATPQRQCLRKLSIAAGSTVADALIASRFESEAGIEMKGASFGIWPKPVQPDHVLREGDRVEIYRPLTADPKDARRRRARA